ncbi:hypothetical protein [Mariniblastus fucicola]|nr:hypothetical protein [Mariniblastus fucicola]
MSDNKTKFFFANCKQCEGIIRIPITIRPDSAVSCPHCSIQFDLVAFLDQIPEVTIVDGPSVGSIAERDSESADSFQIDTGAAEQLDGKFVVPPQLASGIRKRRRRRRKSSSQSSSRDQSTNGTPVNANRQLSEAEELQLERRAERAKREREKLQQQREAAALRNVNLRKPGSRSSSSSRNAQPKRSPAIEVLKIVIGGMFAAPIAYLLLLWVFSRDPLGLVPTINSYAPILVPDGLVLEKDEPKFKLDDSEADSNFSADPDSEFEDGLLDLPIPNTDPDDIKL